MFLELRQYRTHPGQRDNWVKYREEIIIPFQMPKGMVIVGSFVGEEEQDLYVWIRRFESESERERLYEAVYQSDEWRTKSLPRFQRCWTGQDRGHTDRPHRFLRNSLVAKTIDVAVNIPPPVPSAP